jgi:hypothetical protein
MVVCCYHVLGFRILNPLFLPFTGTLLRPRPHQGLRTLLARSLERESEGPVIPQSADTSFRRRRSFPGSDDEEAVKGAQGRPRSLLD